MQNYTDGYVTAFPYTIGYYPETMPQRAAFPLLRMGAAMPRVRTACELGFGQGLSININAASSDIDWWGTDFSPAQAAFARELAAASGANPHLLCQSFADFCARDDLPVFDFVAIHGIWSWISDENRAVIVDFLDKKLAPGGLLYISYNCLPGWAPMAPVRELMALHREATGGSLKEGIGQAIDYVKKLASLDSAYMKLQPSLEKRVSALGDLDPVYLAHEYFNRNWDVRGFSWTADLLRPAMLEYVCQASVLENLPSINFTPEQRKLLAGIDDAVLRESVRDLIVNTQFRRDYWIKGRGNLTPSQANAEILALKFVLLIQVGDFRLQTKYRNAEISLDEKIYMPILDAFADHKPHALGDIILGLRPAGIKPDQILEAIAFLFGKNVIFPAQEPSRKIIDQCRNINDAIEKMARSSGDIGFLASPVLGCGLPLSRLRQLFLLARKSGLYDPEEWARYAVDQLESIGQKIVIDGKVLQTREENIEHATDMAEKFAENLLGVVLKLGAF